MPPLPPATNSPPHSRPCLLVLASTFPRYPGDREPPFVYELSRRLAREFDVTVLAPHAPGAADEEMWDGMRIIRYRYFFTSWQTLAYEGGILANLKANRWRYGLVPFFLLAQGVALIKLLRATPYAVIHAHWLIPQGALALLARRFAQHPPALLCTSHGGDLYGLSAPWWRRVKTWVLRHSDTVTTVSHAMHQAALALGGDATRMATVPMGVDLVRQFVPEPMVARDVDILFVGRMVEKKGVDVLLAAFARIAPDFPAVRLTLAGHGPELPHLREFARPLGERVTFLGALANDQLPDWYRRAKIVAFPSRIAQDGDREGFGLVLVEALGCGCAVIASDLPAMQDIVQHEETAWITAQGDIDALAQGLARLLQDAPLRTRLAQAGRARVVALYDWEVIAARYTTLLRTLCAG